MESIAKLAWRCRRGALELDLLLSYYLENHYLSADSQEKTLFLDFLALEDYQLQFYLIENQCHPNDPFYPLIQKMKAS